MENRKLYRLVSVAVILFAGLMQSFTVSAETKVLSANGKTYVLDYSKRKIYNGQQSKSIEKVETQGFDVENYQFVTETFKNTLSDKRLKDLKNEMVLTTFVCDVNGSIQSVEFLFKKTPFLTAEEIEKLESSLLRQSFNITTDIKEDQRIKFSIPCFFSMLQD